MTMGIVITYLININQIWLFLKSKWGRWWNFYYKKWKNAIIVRGNASHADSLILFVPNRICFLRGSRRSLITLFLFALSSLVYAQFHRSEQQLLLTSTKHWQKTGSSLLSLKSAASIVRPPLVAVMSLPYNSLPRPLAKLNRARYCHGWSSSSINKERQGYLLPRAHGLHHACIRTFYTRRGSPVRISDI